MSGRVVALAAALSLPATAAFAQGAQAPTVKVKLSRFAKVASGLQLGATFGLGRDGKRRILTATKLVLPRGTTFNTKAVARCTATDDQISAAPGGAADVCPPASEIGSATAQVYIGEGATPVEFGGSIWNFSGEMLVELDIGDTPAYYIAGTIKANTVSYSLSTTEQLNARAAKVTIKLDKAGTKRRPYLRTPSTCPEGRWKASAVDTFSGGVTQTARTTIACRKTRH
jgi:hypothetical protein